MSLAKWFASIRERHSSQQFSYERGALISRRLQELLAVPTPTRSIRPPLTPVVKTTQHPTATVVYIRCGASKEVTWVTLHRTGEKFDRSLLVRIPKPFGTHHPLSQTKVTGK
jgi:hypothetical protein